MTTTEPTGCWDCARCTFKNKKQHLICECCLQRKPRVRAPKRKITDDYVTPTCPKRKTKGKSGDKQTKKNTKQQKKKK